MDELATIIDNEIEKENKDKDLSFYAFLVDTGLL